MWIVLLVLVCGPTWAFGMCPVRCTCNDNSLRVSCTSAALDVVPIQLNPEVQHIDLSNNKISTIEYIFVIYINLVSLDLSQNKIHILGSGNFDSQRHLKHLNLSHNAIDGLSKDSLKGLRALDELDLSFNKLEELSGHAFRELSSLRVLKLKGNSLLRLEEGLFKPLKYLKELFLDDNQLMEIPGAAIADAESLQKLSLSGNLIETVEDDMPALPELKFLSLDKNIMTDIKQGAFAGLPTLTYLDISDNNFTAVPTDPLCKLGNLTELRFSGNVIDSVPPVAFRGLFHLKCLHLDRQAMLNKIDPRAFVDNINLERLRLDDNIAVEYLPTRLFYGNPKLTHISVRNNQLSKVDASHFPLDQLKTLKLSGNPWQCNCSLMWLWQLGQEQVKTSGNESEPTKLTIDIESVICNGPKLLEKRKLVEVKEWEFGCSHDWKTAVSAIVFACLVLIGASVVVYYGHAKNQRRKKNNTSRDGPPCTNGTNLPLTLPYDDGRSGKCIVGVGPQIIHEYETLPPWNPYAKPQPMPYSHYDATLNMKPHIVYV